MAWSPRIEYEGACCDVMNRGSRVQEAYGAEAWNCRRSCWGSGWVP